MDQPKFINKLTELISEDLSINQIVLLVPHAMELAKDIKGLSGEERKIYVIKGLIELIKIQTSDEVDYLLDFVSEHVPLLIDVVYMSYKGVFSFKNKKSRLRCR